MQKIRDSEQYYIPFGIDITKVVICLVYDGNTVSIIEDTPAVHLANQLSRSGSTNPIKILKGGYERFSGEYSFLRTQKILYTPMELEHLPLYPSEILPLFLYLGDKRHAYNAALNYELKIRSHVNASRELYTAFPGSINELHIEIDDNPDVDILLKFKEACDYIESCRKKSERVLVFGDRGVSRSVTIVAAYLIKYKNMDYRESLAYIRECRPHIKPLMAFIEQLHKWQEQK
jgi:hypothetical protein